MLIDGPMAYMWYPLVVFGLDGFLGEPQRLIALATRSAVDQAACKL